MLLKTVAYWFCSCMFIKVNVLNVVLISSAITIVIWCILFHCSFSVTVSLALPTKEPHSAEIKSDCEVNPTLGCAGL